MPNSSAPQHQLHKTLLRVLLACGLVALFATIMHWSEAAPQLMDLIIPPSVVAICFTLAAILHRHPQSRPVVFGLFIATCALAITIPAWACSWSAFQQPDIRLIDIYPPITSMLLVLLILVLAISPTRTAWRWGVLIWLANAVPVIGYLLAHPAELWTPRGKDMLISFGPVFLFLVLVVPYLRRFSSRLRLLQNQFEVTKAMVERDPLTELYNRRGADRLMNESVNADAPLAVLLLDIDHFKSINDNHGHDIGDAVLRDVASRILHNLRPDNYAARWGGEEFLIILNTDDETLLTAIANRLHKAIQQVPFEIAGKITASIGGAILKRGESINELLKEADRALYKAKDQGRDCVVIDPANNTGS
ncbi:GGDEF domain-containing protein [Porticoccaceae bacterium LTM1]|nr:GGDEF domain-containing protein [Porticoccaceae bacterium LTM1]